MTLKNRVRQYVMWQRHKLKMSALREDHPLRYLFMEVTRSCNLACAYCGSSCTGRTPEGEMTSAQWVEIIKQIAEDFEPRTIMVAVTGGEPLIKEGIFDIFAALRDHGFRYGMVTNGQLLDRDKADKLVISGIGSISLSLDALPEENDRLRGRGVFEGVKTAVANLKAAGYKGKLEIISTITKPTVQTLDQMRQLVAQMKVPLWRAAPVMPIGRAAEHPELIPDSMDIRAMLEWMREARKDSFLPKPEFSEEGFLGNRFEGHVRPYLVQCRAGITVGGIRFDGRISACPELTDAFDQGHIRDSRFKEVWDKKYQVMRNRSWARKGICGDCGQFELCQGGALHLYQDPGSDILRCLYKMCKDTDNRPVPCIGCGGERFLPSGPEGFDSPEK